MIVDKQPDGPRRPVAMPLWYLRTYEDEDTHWGLFDGTTVTSVCHEKFEPMVTALPGIEPVMALHGDPADPAQVCPRCQRAIAHGQSAPAGEADRSIGRPDRMDARELTSWERAPGPPGEPVSEDPGPSWVALDDIDRDLL